MSLLESVDSELKKAEKEAAKAKLKTLVTDYKKSLTVTAGIASAMVELLTSVGETETEIRNYLSKL